MVEVGYVLLGKNSACVQMFILKEITLVLKVKVGG